MRRLIISLLLTFPFAALMAQNEELSYFLPKTELRFQVLIERTEYTPGEFAKYSERLLRKTASEQKQTTYRVAGVSMYTTAIPDSAKYFAVPLDKKHTIFTVERASNGILMALNAKRKEVQEPEKFVPSKQQLPVNPHDYMSEEILSAGSTAKMAELTAREIYDIRSSRNDLNRGEAEYMPNDGQQLRIMLANLDKQESVLTQMFQGVTTRDTTQYELVYVPDKGEEKAVLFRLSKYLGLVDNDDMSGVPYYITVEDLQIIPRLKTDADGEKNVKGDVGITVNMPGKIRITLTEGTKQIAQFETYAAQYGTLESLSSTLFSKKQTSHVQLNPVNGNVESIQTEPVD
ncbi:MAG: DUF4831 family protein [Prevotella sp.]|nr:DUF4831 family protein [Prevotella sp.]